MTSAPRKKPVRADQLRILSNMQPGQQVSGVGEAFMRFFGDEVAERLMVRGGRGTDTADTGRE